MADMYRSILDLLARAGGEPQEEETPMGKKIPGFHQKLRDQIAKDTGVGENQPVSEKAFSGRGMAGPPGPWIPYGAMPPTPKDLSILQLLANQIASRKMMQAVDSNVDPFGASRIESGDPLWHLRTKKGFIPERSIEDPEEDMWSPSPGLEYNTFSRGEQIR